MILDRISPFFCRVFHILLKFIVLEAYKLHYVSLSIILIHVKAYIIMNHLRRTHENTKKMAHVDQRRIHCLDADRMLCF